MANKIKVICVDVSHKETIKNGKVIHNIEGFHKELILNQHYEAIIYDYVKDDKNKYYNQVDIFNDITDKWICRMDSDVFYKMFLGLSEYRNKILEEILNG